MATGGGAGPLLASASSSSSLIAHHHHAGSNAGGAGGAGAPVPAGTPTGGAVGGAPGAGHDIHQLSLKVMRLSRPTLAERTPAWWEAGDLPVTAPTASPSDATPFLAAATPAQTSNVGLPPEVAASVERAAALKRLVDASDVPINAERRNPFQWDPDRANALFGIMPMLRLPQNFGSIYLGETFASYICINNDSGVAVRDVTVKAELQVRAGATPRAGAQSWRS